MSGNVVTNRTARRDGQRVLVGHEDTGTCMLVRQALEEQFTVCVALNAYDFLEWLSEYRFAAIVCDLVGERMRGKEMLDLVARVSPDLAPRVVLLAPRELDRELARFLETCGNPWVPRPVLGTELLEIVRAVAARSTSMPP